MGTNIVLKRTVLMQSTLLFFGSFFNSFIFFFEILSRANGNDGSALVHRCVLVNHCSVPAQPHRSRRSKGCNYGNCSGNVASFGGANALTRFFRQMMEAKSIDDKTDEAVRQMDEE